MKLTEEQVRAIQSTVKAAVPAGYGYYLILCPTLEDEKKVVAIGNLDPEILPTILRGMADSMEEDPPTKLQTS